MSKTQKIVPPVNQGFTKEQAAQALESDLKTLSALLMWIRSTPAVKEMLVDFAVGQHNNKLNAQNQPPIQ